MFGLLNSSQIYGLQQAHDQQPHSHHSHINPARHSIASLIGKGTITATSTTSNNNHKHRRIPSSASDSGCKENRFFASLSSIQGIRTPTNFIEKFIKSELLNGYDSLKNYKNCQQLNNSATTSVKDHQKQKQKPTKEHQQQQQQREPQRTSPTSTVDHKFDSYRYRSAWTDDAGDSYETINVITNRKTPESVRTDGNNHKNTNTNSSGSSSSTSRSNNNKNREIEMTIKCSKNLLAEPPQIQAPATLQNYHKLPECEQDLIITPTAATPVSSGASSGEFNTEPANNSPATTAALTAASLYKRLSFGGGGGRSSVKHGDITTLAQANESASDNSSSSISTTTTTNSSSSSSLAKSISLSLKSNDLKRSSSSSSGDCTSARERKKSLSDHATSSIATMDGNATPVISPERAQRRKLMQMIAAYDQQNKLLHRELAKEKRRRSEELACVVKSLLCFESKLKGDMKAVNQRLIEKDTEICRLVRQNRVLKKELVKMRKVQNDSARDEGVVEDDDADDSNEENLTVLEREFEKGHVGVDDNNVDEQQLMADCLELEALQCINCRTQFYDIELKEGWTQTTSKDGSRKNDGHTTEFGSSSDDTVSSSFYGARRSVRYTSKRTSGTFRDYMRSRSMNIDDPALDNNSEENASTISRDDSQTSYEKVYSRTIERMHGVKCEREAEQNSEMEIGTRSASRLSIKSSASSRSSCSKASDKSAAQNADEDDDDDDGIFSPTQDDDFEEDLDVSTDRPIKIVPRRIMEFSEASPQQVYETSTDDWYASASDQEEIGTATAKSYGHGAVNPVLECVNQILLQQSMDETVVGESGRPSPTGQAPQRSPVQAAPANLPRRSSLSGRRSSRNNSRFTEGGQTSRNGTLTRKRVHFSTKNSMVHVPRNDDDEDGGTIDVRPPMISILQEPPPPLPQYHPMDYFPLRATASSPTPDAAERERLETLNYESIYSNEYEPIGSEHNSSNLYVDMETASKPNTPGSASPTVNCNAANRLNASPLDAKMPKTPPALPPKPANLLKFRKPMQQLDEMPDEHLQQQQQSPQAQDCDSSSTPTIVSEPDYCSISEVNGITSVQIVADVHKAPDSEADVDAQLEAPISELELEVSTVASDDTFAASQKTEEIEEIFADIPKLPNVAAIIAPKAAKTTKPKTQAVDYLTMMPREKTTPRKLIMSSGGSGTGNGKDYLGPSTPTKSPKLDSSQLKLQLNVTNGQHPQHQYKRKHMPSILAEINKRMSLPNNPTTTPTTPKSPKPSLNFAAGSILKGHEDAATVVSASSLPLQAEFDWYNLDAEYGRAAPMHNQSDLLKLADNLNGSGSGMLAEIHEDHESVVASADEYNLDEEFSLANDKQTESPAPETPCEDGAGNDPEAAKTTATNVITTVPATGNIICEAINFPLINDNSPFAALTVAPLLTSNNIADTKIQNNLANFEKFIEGSGLSSKPLPSKRKIYFAGPFV